MWRRQPEQRQMSARIPTNDVNCVQIENRVT